LTDLIPSIPEYEFEDLVEQCIHLTAPPEEDGYTVFEKEKGKQRQWAGFGLTGLDDLVGDWDGTGVIELSGPRRVGKSVSCLNGNA
jgi:DNA repair protein RAD51